jgi:WD40 repeat protein
LLQDTKRFILVNVGTFNKAPLQIYSSALVFVPENSIVRKLYEKHIPSWLSTLPAMQSHWDPCLATIESQYSSRLELLTLPTDDRFLTLAEDEIKLWDIKTTSCTAVHNDALPQSVKMSSDGKELVYLSGQEVLQIIDTATRSCIAEFTGHTDKIKYAMFSADDQQIASASIDGSLKIWDRATRKCIATYEFNHGDRMMGFSPDGMTFLIISDLESIHLLNSRTTSCKLTISHHGKRVTQAVFSPDSQKLISVDSGGTIKILNIHTGTGSIAEGANSGTGRTLVFFSGGDQFICTMRDDVERGHAIGIWNTAKVTCDSLLEGHRASISDIVLSSDERRIASASYDKSIRIWDTQSKSCIATYNGHDEQITSIIYSVDETLLISADINGNLKVWDTGLETQSAKVESHGSAVLEVIFSPDKKRIVTTSGDRTVKLWDTITGECIATGEDHRLFAWVPLIVPQDIPTAPFDHIMINHGLFGWPRSVEFSPDSSKFLSSGESGDSASLKLWNANTGDCELLLQEAPSSIVSIAFSPDGVTIASTFRDGTLMYWDTATQRPIDPFGGEMYVISYSTYSPDGTYLIFGCDDGVVRVCHLPTQNCKEMSEAHESPVLLVAMSADGTKLASYSKSAIKIWEMGAYTCIATYSSKTGSSISQILFSPDSQYLIVLYEAGKIKIVILDAATGHCIDELRICGLANHIAFDPTRSSLIITNVGTFTFDPPAPQAANTIGLGLSRDGEWVTWNSCNMLWLPPTFRISASDIDVAASVIALGSRLGRLLLIGVDSSKMPPVASASQPSGRHTRPLS